MLAALRAGNPDGLPNRYDAVMIKALLAHGTSLGSIEGQVLAAPAWTLITGMRSVGSLAGMPAMGWPTWSGP